MKVKEKYSHEFENEVELKMPIYPGKMQNTWDVETKTIATGKNIIAKEKTIEHDELHFSHYYILTKDTQELIMGILIPDPMLGDKEKTLYLKTQNAARKLIKNIIDYDITSSGEIYFKIVDEGKMHIRTTFGENKNYVTFDDFIIGFVNESKLFDKDKCTRYITSFLRGEEPENKWEEIWTA